MCGGSSEKIKIFTSNILLYYRCLALYHHYKKESALIVMVVRGDLDGKTNKERYIIISESVPFIICTISENCWSSGTCEFTCLISQCPFPLLTFFECSDYGRDVFSLDCIKYRDHYLSHLPQIYKSESL